MIIYMDQDKMRSLVNRVQDSGLSDFYRGLYERAGISQDSFDAMTPESFQKLPCLGRSDIANAHPDKRLYVDKSRVAFVSYTSGTTSGTPLVMYWSSVADYHFEPSIGTASRTPLILHPALNKNFGHTFIQQCRQADTPVTPVFADFQNLDQSAIIAERTSSDGIYTTPTLASMIADQIDRLYDASKIRLLALFSENLTSLKRKRLKERYPNAKIANLYASSEAGQILFFPCQHVLERESDEFHYIEDALVALELSEEGELILTMDQNEAFPLIRYRTGDYFEIAEKPCECGNGQKLLRWSGRMDVDKVRMYGMEMRSEDIEQALESCRAITGDAFQIHFYPDASSERSERIRIVLEVPRASLPARTEFAEAEARDQLRQALLDGWRLSPTATLRTAVERGLAAEPEIAFVDELSTRTLKTRRMVNHIS